jgi:hypothetical protein
VSRPAPFASICDGTCPFAAAVDGRYRITMGCRIRTAIAALWLEFPAMLTSFSLFMLNPSQFRYRWHNSRGSIGERDPNGALLPG